MDPPEQSQQPEENSKAPKSGTEIPVQNVELSGTSVQSSKASGAETTKTEWQKNIESQLNDLKDDSKELNRDRVSVITILGIFVAIFTFISVEIQILRFICDFFKILGFTLIMPGVLLLFIALLDYVARSWIKNTEKLGARSLVIVIILAITLIAGGSFLSLKEGDDWKCGGDEMKSVIEVNTEPFDGNLEVKLPDSIKVELK